MTNRERVLAALRHQQPDKTPFHIKFTHMAYQQTAEYFGDPDFGDKLGNCLTIVDAGSKMAWAEVAPDIFEDPFGVQWDQKVDKDIGVVCNCRVTPETLADYRFPEIGDFSTTMVRRNADQFIVADLGFSLFERAWTLAGMEDILAGMIAEPEFVNELLDRILEYNLRVIDRACAGDIDAMLFGDDWGQQTGLIMGPALWREFIKPRIAQMYGRVKSYGKFVFIHSCGKIDEVFPDLIEIGLDAFNPFQPEVIDVDEIKKQFGDRLTFYGGISTQRTLPFGTPDQVRDEVKRLLETIGVNGGYIASPAHDIPADAKPENIAAMIEVLQNQ